MKKITKIAMFLILLSVLAVGCSNEQRSSMEEAGFVVQKLSDYQELVQYFSVQSTSTLDFDPELYLESESEISFIHEVIYKTKNGSFKLVLLDDSRPPKIVLTREFN